MSAGGIAETKDFGILFKHFHFSDAAVVDATAQTSAALEQSPQGSQDINHLTVLMAFNPTTFATTDTAIMSLVIEDSADGSSWAPAAAPYQPVAAITVAVPGNPVGTPVVKRYDIDIGSLRAFVRFKGSIDLTGTAAGRMQLIGIAAGALQQPYHVAAYGTTDFQPVYKA